MDRMGTREATALVRYIRQSGWVNTSNPHLHDMMRKRNVTIQDIDHCLMMGRVLRDAEWNEGWKEWRYRVEGEDAEGEELVVVVAFEDQETLAVITVF